MKLKIKIGVWLCCSLALLSCGKKGANEWMLCGDDKVWIIDAGKSNGADVHTVWTWERSELLGQVPEEFQNYLISMDECKFVDNGKKLLLASSSGGVLLLDRATKKCLFYAYCPMAHSVELLPGNRIAVALSTNPKGNSLELFDVDKSNQILFRDSLYSGHGSVWMEKQQKLYALGYDDLREYSLSNWDTESPSLTRERTWKIPHLGGHDLSAVSDNELLVTDHDGVSLFNIDTQTFTPFEPLAAVPNIKSVNYDKATGRLVYTKAEESWWTFNLYQENPGKVIRIPEIKLYKVRTNPF